MRTDEELLILAKDVDDKKIFLTNKMDVIMNSFAMFILHEDGEVPDDVGAVYEYLDKASPLIMNGCPTFGSINYLTYEEAKKLMDYISDLKEKKDEQ